MNTTATTKEEAIANLKLYWRTEYLGGRIERITTGTGRHTRMYWAVTLGNERDLEVNYRSALKVLTEMAKGK